MSNMRDRILQGKEEPKKNKQDTQEDTYGKGLSSPWVKATGYFLLTVGLLWGSGLFFSALAASVSAFKKMSRSFKD
jgi:hypothetical protein